MAYQFFTDAEVKCKCGCEKQQMQPDFMKKLDLLRAHYGKPLHVTSGFRCESYNCKVSTTGPNGPHTTGRAVDISITGPEAFRLVQLALGSHSFSGIGIQQTGPHEGRFIHLDDLKGSQRPWLWSYPKRA